MPEMPLPTNDHDLLIKLNANFETFTNQYRIDVRELKDGTTKTLADHELRISKIEDIINQVQPTQTYAEFKTLQLQFNNVIVGAKVARFFTGIITGILGGISVLVTPLLVRWISSLFS